MLDNLIPAIPVPVLPESYDLSASYMELLMTCVNKLNAMIKLVNDETTALNEVKEQINLILPYLDDLAHMGERFEAMQAEIDTLRNQLYDETDGDIPEIRTQLANQLAMIESTLIVAESAKVLSMRCNMFAGVNFLHETWHANDATVRGIQIHYDNATGWFHLTGVMTASQTDTEFALAEYEFAEPFRSAFGHMDDYQISPPGILEYSGLLTLWNKNMMNSAAYDYADGEQIEFYNGASRIMPFIATRPADTVSWGYNTTPRLIIKFKARENAAESLLNMWITPHYVKAIASDYNETQEQYYPIPANAVASSVLSQQISAEAAARQTAINSESTARESADAALQLNISQIDTRLTAETEMRLSEDQTLATQIDSESDTRAAADRTLQTNIDNLENDIPDTVIATVYGVGTTISATVDNPIALNDTILPGEYICGASAAAYVTNQPNHGAATAGFRMSVSQMFTTAGRVRQTIRYNSTALAGKIFERIKYSNGWGSWYLYQGTVVPDPE